MCETDENLDYYNDDIEGIDDDELTEDAEEIFYQLLEHFGPDYFELELED